MVLDSFRAIIRIMELAEAEKEKKEPCVEPMSDEQLDSAIMEYVRKAIDERRDEEDAPAE